LSSIFNNDISINSAAPLSLITLVVVMLIRVEFDNHLIRFCLIQNKSCKSIHISAKNVLGMFKADYIVSNTTIRLKFNQQL